MPKFLFCHQLEYILGRVCTVLFFVFLSLFSTYFRSKFTCKLSKLDFKIWILMDLFFIPDDSFDPSDFLGLPQVQSSMKMEQEQHLPNPEFMPPQPVSNMSDIAPNDTFKQDLLQTAIELDQTDQIQENQMFHHQQQPNPDEIMMSQQHQHQLDHDQMMMHQQQIQEQLMLQQQQSQDQMMNQHSMEEQMNMNPPMEITAPVTQDIHDDLAISDSDDEDGKGHPPPLAMKTQEDEEDGGLWF